MKNLFWEFCSIFVLGRERRKAFRRKHIRSPFQKLEHNIARKVELTVRRALSTMALHQRAFPPFKNKAAGRDVVVVAGGPSAAKFRPIPGAIYIGVNRAYKFSGISFDYLFCQDYEAVRGSDALDAIRDYRRGQCVKFIGLVGDDAWNNGYVFPESYVIEMDALRYRVVQGTLDDFAYDISVQPLADCGSVVFSALQFALWMNPRRLYLVGCDCSHGGYFYKNGNVSASGANTLDLDRVMQGYVWFKQFAQRYYPKTEIISVNPVGLKGLFIDQDQETAQGLEEKGD
jgi:hypothetical protein